MFSKKPAQPPRSAAGKPMANSTFSVFGADIKIKGDVHASADLHIDGHVEGDVSCTALVQGESGEIVGSVKAENARLSGTVKGTINVRDLVVLKSARIQGDVHYDSLTIEQGAQVDGRFAPRAVGEDSAVVAFPAG
jgi:cytoskeletal protein CcmA (bactofilin family)